MNYFLNSAGRVVPVPPEQVQDATSLGWVPASPKQIADFEIQAKYDAPVTAAAEAAGSALTFGLSTAVERHLGVPAEDIAGREKANPLASGIGTAAGVMGGLFVPGSAPSLIAKAGKATAEAVATRVASRAAALGLGSAVEGAAYGAGQVVHEAALGDPNLTAESALASVGLSAALAGGIGVGAGALGSIFKEGAKHLPGWLEDVEAHANLQAAGGDKVLARRMRDKFGDEGMKQLLLEMRTRGIVDGVISTPATVMGKAQEVSQAAGQKIGDMLRAADVNVPRAMPRAALDEALGVAAKLGENPFEEGTAKGLQDLLARYEAKFAVTGGATLEELHDMEGQFGQQVYGLKGQRNPTLDPYIKSLNRIRGRISDAVDKGVIESGAVPEGAWTEANRSFQVAKEAQKLAQNGLNRLAGNNPVSASALLGGVAGAAASGPMGAVATTVGTEAAKRYGSGVMGWAARGLREQAEAVVNRTGDLIASARQAGGDLAATNAPETVAALSFLERNNQKISQRIESAAAAVVRGSDSATETSAALTAAEFNEHSERFQRFAADPAQLQTVLEQQAGGLDAHAPQTAQALQVASARAAGFLASKLPIHTPGGPLAAKWEPTASEREVFSRYYEAIENPLGVLKHAAQGTLTTEALEAVQAVYPALFAKMQASVVDALAQHDPTGHRLMLSMLLGQDVDGSMSGAAILAAQAQFVMPPAMPPRPVSPGKVKFGAGQRMQTDLERTARRGVK